MATRRTATGKKPASQPRRTSKTDDQALKWMREVCLALPGTSEGVHYGEIVFKVGPKLFASCGDKRGTCTIVFQIDARKTEELLAADARFARYPYEKSALWIKASDVDDWEQMRAFVEESYRRQAGGGAPAKPTAKKAVRRGK